MPVVLVAGLALMGGGFDVEGRHTAGIFAWLFVGAFLLSPSRRDTRFNRSFIIVAGLLLSLALLSALSSVWSDATARSFIEAERVVAYIGFLTAAFLVCQTSSGRKRLVEGIVIAIGLIVLLGLVDRCFPGAGITPVDATSRLRYPLGYWNANGLVFGVGITLFAWTARRGEWAPLRLLSVAFIPAAMAGLYLTYSRGGLLAGLVSVVLMFFLSSYRLHFISVIASGLVVAIPTIAFIQSKTLIAQNLGGEGAPAEGRTVAFAILLSMVLAVAIFLIAARIVAASPAIFERAVAISRDRRLLRGVGVAGTVALLTVAIIFGGHVWDQFSDNEISFPDDPEQHFIQLSGAGRYQFNQVALEAIGENPLLGTGAGTYNFEWTQNRPNDLAAQDAHSLYLEAFAELGIFGGLLVLALAGFLLATGVAVFRGSSGPERDLAAVLLAVQATMLMALAIDWTWEMAATAALLLLVSAAQLGQLNSEQRAGRSQQATYSRAYTPVPRARTILGLTIVWAAVVILTVPLAADKYVGSAERATADGRLTDAVQASERSSDLNPFAPQPHVQLGVIAQSLGLDDRALAEFTRAIELEPRNWQWWYLRMRAHSQYGNSAEAQADYEQAKSLNPRSPNLQDPPQ